MRAGIAGFESRRGGLTCLEIGRSMSNGRFMVVGNLGDRLSNMFVYSRGCKVGDGLQSSVVNVHEHCLAKEPPLVLCRSCHRLTFTVMFPSGRIRCCRGSDTGKIHQIAKLYPISHPRLLSVPDVKCGGSCIYNLHFQKVKLVQFIFQGCIL